MALIQEIEVSFIKKDSSEEANPDSVENAIMK